jgi:hypothetical protein
MCLSYRLAVNSVNTTRTFINLLAVSFEMSFPRVRLPDKAQGYMDKDSTTETCGAQFHVGIIMRNDVDGIHGASFQTIGIPDHGFGRALSAANYPEPRD